MQQTLDIDPIVTNPHTGVRYQATCSDDWIPRLKAWKKDREYWCKRLDPILTRAARRNSWALYNAAKRACYARALPVPMPMGHLMFESPTY